MTIYEIVFGVALALVCVVIILFTLAQQKSGQGLSSSIMGSGSGMMDASRYNVNDLRMAKITKIAGGIFFAIALVVCVLIARLG